MFYKSTRNSSDNVKVSSAEAIAQGISVEGGLFIPESIPQLSIDEIVSLGDKKYSERAAFVLSKYLTDFSSEELRLCSEKAYTCEKFSTEDIVEIAHLVEGTYVLELWHGPTCAFKDMALQILPHLMTTSMKKIGCDKRLVILVATSGDTGKAALEGFKDVEGTEIIVFYPEDGVSVMQKRQMATQDGGNVTVCSIKGNFDDAQNGVKQIFTNEQMRNKLEQNSMMFSSANSINWGRLVPQIVYYISSYASLVADGELEKGEKVNIVVPTGNFGNILAAYYAKRMGIPVNKLICASNANNVLTDFINTGIYDRNREFITTISPSMDILISSNLERLLYILCGDDDKQIVEWFGALGSIGKYEVSDSVKASLNSEFYSGYCDDNETKDVIKSIFDKYSYVCDTHTAVGIGVYQQYKAKTGDTSTKTIIASTANPYKFSDSVLKAVDSDNFTGLDEFEMAEKLSTITGCEIPTELLDIRRKVARFDDIIEKSQMSTYVKTCLGV